MLHSTARYTMCVLLLLQILAMVLFLIGKTAVLFQLSYYTDGCFTKTGSGQTSRNESPKTSIVFAGSPNRLAIWVGFLFYGVGFGGIGAMLGLLVIDTFGCESSRRRDKTQSLSVRAPLQPQYNTSLSTLLSAFVVDVCVCVCLIHLISFAACSETLRKVQWHDSARCGGAFHHSTYPRWCGVRCHGHTYRLHFAITIPVFTLSMLLLAAGKPAVASQEAKASAKKAKP